MESILQEKIETLRTEMINQVLINGSLTHEKVVSVSQLLDRYILLYQKFILKQAKLKCIC
ncbi:Spo0E family sporulation regulatory protein-aspartic acid phosphatase [Paenibacillus sp. GCM10023248]|uniref:aspartyl-phosphate phosphatase Spo0E family protein n=1 Tax=unclassified Paenibacillus TaxID=185978 RepID=UPI002378AFCA|nr:aspartyl-phosphate phosphatase Spo0E family protein [Paenibacillus sp. MAHUQ-63]MDD9269464.1 aspartyl-phosphate phosphatase Spo0E family protein [Paenibacillus sp. MAHUQ-63]